ncbi:MAG TPA: glutamine amidotransferase [Hyphomicrobiales bacterium]|nr:glutamine amidotransferase [Hyphomicrobiales bacterium]
MKPLLILKAGNAIAGLPAGWGDFEDWIVAAVALPEVQWRCCDVSAGEELPLHETVAGVIVTGSAAMVTDRLPWSERAAAWLAQAVAHELPTLGICYGHQLLAHALGGEVGYHPAGREMGTKQIHALAAAATDPLFGALPATYPAHVTHSQTVLQPPPGAAILAANSFELHHALRFGPRAWGVQYHPEFTAPIMDKYLELRSRNLAEEGQDVARLRREVQPTPQAQTLLQRFAGQTHAQ